MIEWYRKAVEGGSSDALLKLGSCYEKGLGVPQDKIEAWKLYYRSKEMNDPNADSRLHTLGYRVMIQAAEMGIVEAQYALGEAYQTGKERNLEQDLELAVIWYGKAAQNGSDKAKAALNHCLYDIRIKAQENNSAYSQNILGVCYYYGYGVDKDVKQAEEWFKKAAERGNEKAENNLRRLKF